MIDIKPFLRWAGGKFKLTDSLIKFIPVEYNHYWEPFLGAGSLFFKLKPNRATLSDLNESLIECYKQIKENPKEVSTILDRILKKHSESNFYLIRDQFNKSKTFDSTKAAMFIYINKTCFNGIYRVNQNNEFNVPYGKILIPATPSVEELLRISERLNNIELYSYSYENILEKVSERDFIYLDPPYPPLSETAKFAEYTKEKFTINDQQAVALFAKRLADRGCFVMISNANTPFIQSLYNEWNINKTSVRRTISCKKEKYNVEELIITNY